MIHAEILMNLLAFPSSESIIRNMTSLDPGKVRRNDPISSTTKDTQR